MTEDKYEKYGKIYEEFRQMARELKVPIITCIKEQQSGKRYFVPDERPKADVIMFDYVYLLK